MQRRELVVGDPPARGGRILPYTPPFTKEIMGQQVAIIGGRVYCEACASVGVIAKAGGSRRTGYITEVALEGDLCVCQCPKPQPLVSMLQNLSFVDDADYGATLGIPLWEAGSKQHLVASKVVDEQVQHLAQTQQQAESICPNMTNEAFARLMMELRRMWDASTRSPIVGASPPRFASPTSRPALSQSLSSSADCDRRIEFLARTVPAKATPSC